MNYIVQLTQGDNMVEFRVLDMKHLIDIMYLLKDEYNDLEVRITQLK